ncbi:hypothetical protein AArcSl_0228 [Halalkaliarchaeum desulfuricum]|uniref:GTP-dependent dephospho-CoA kinase n=1 Tax=Halalkaliarchaeum desulfuricum TaxID=2055893 RepID=A0A343TFL1_9EURY|nr:hypothetical protein AArcSl_0228 [Halalkaliarchaeum desulfuricum]
MADLASDGGADDPTLLCLPDELRTELKDPLGAIYTDANELLSAIDEFAAEHGDSSNSRTPKLVAVGDVVTAHLLDTGRRPDLAVVDGRTERESAPESVLETIEDATDDCVGKTVENPAAVLRHELLVALREGLSSQEPTVVRVDGEEDLAALPAVLAVPVGSSVVYGQPGEGMVHVAVTDAVKREVRELLTKFDGDSEAAFRVLEPKRS